MSPLEFLCQPIWQRLGLALLHFLWQGVVIAAAVLAIVHLLRLRHGNARYAVYLLGFIAMSVCPLVTFTMLETPDPAAAVPVVSQGGSEPVDSSAYTPVPSSPAQQALLDSGVSPVEQDTTVAAELSVLLQQRISAYLQQLLPWGVLGWFAGVVVLSVRLLLGFVGMHRWRSRTEQLEQHLRDRVAVLSARLGMNGFSRVFVSPAALEAVAIGYLRPTVLLPVSMVTQMPPEMLEAVIAHELAHIRRLDLWVNLFQRVAETLLFYHPALWWLSSRLRAEREFCCDELAVKATRQRATYASALENVARARPLFKPPALAAGLGRGDKPILGRVRNVLGLAPTHQNSRFWVAGMLAMLLLAALVVPVTIAFGTRNAIIELPHAGHSNAAETSVQNVESTGKAGTQGIQFAKDPPVVPAVIRGVVRDEAGKPAEGVLILPLPYGGYPVETDADGKFELAGPTEDRRIETLFVRDLKNNTAVAVVLADYSKLIDITLVQGAILIGRITDPNGMPIAGAKIHPSVHTEEWAAAFGYTFFEPTDNNGVYEIKALPVGQDYEISVGRVEGHGRNSIRLGLLDLAGRKELDDIVLEPTNLSVSGIALDDNLKPIVDVYVQASGKHQPTRKVKTDSAGKFKIDGLCKGRLSLDAWTADRLWESFADEANGGDSDVELYMTRATKSRGCLIAAKSAPLVAVGKVLPDLEQLGIHLAKEDIRGKRILVCFWKLTHDESRDCIRQLAARSEELAKQDIVVVAAEIWPRNEKHFRRWLTQNNVEFPVSILPDPWKQVPDQRTFHLWGVKGYVPWLILTDKEHVVTGEGFGLDELDEKLKATQHTSAVPAPALSPKRKDERPNNLAGKAGTRVIQFPKDQSMGVVYVGELRTTDPWWWQGWEEVGEAKGDVAVPADKDVRLTVNTNGVENLSFLEALGPDDIQALNFVYPLKRLDDEGLVHLPGLTGLRLLRLDGASIDGEGLRHLTKLKRLESLGLHSTEVGDEALKHVGQIRSLLALGLATTPVTDKGLAHLRNLNLLQTIALGKTSITGTGFSHLVGLESLTYAHFYGSGLTDEGLREVAKLKSLEILYLGGTKVTDRGIAHLEVLTRLRELHLTGTDDISDASLEHIGKITSLENLDLPDGVTDAGLQYLTSLKRLKRLNIARMLYLGGGLEPLKNFEKLECLLPPEVTDEDLAVLGTLSSLQELTINNSPITNEGLAHLAGLKSLKKLWLHNGVKSINMDVTVSGLNALKGIPLTYLHLWNIRLDESRLESLGGFPTLEELNLKQMPICDEDLAVVGKLSQLTWLTFTTDTVSDGGLEYLTGLTRLEDFQPITPLTDKGLYHIGKMRMKGRLVVKGHFTDEGLRHLEGLSSLRQLKVTTSGEISTEAKERLRRKLPNLSYCSVGRSREVRQRPKVGEAAPPFALKPLDDDSDSDEEIRLEGKAVLLYFWATWCTPCKASTPALKQLYAKLKKRHGDRFVMLGLSLESNKTSVRRYVEIEAIPWPQICISRNSQTAVDYGVASVPMYYVIGPDGRIVYSDHDDKGDSIEAAVGRVLSE